jgi:hypothetical protein
VYIPRNKTSLLGSNTNMSNWKIKATCVENGQTGVQEVINSWDAPQGIITYLNRQDIAEIWVVVTTLQHKFLDVKVGFRSLVRDSRLIGFSRNQCSERWWNFFAISSHHFELIWRRFLRTMGLKAPRSVIFLVYDLHQDPNAPEDLRDRWLLSFDEHHFNPT